MEEGPAIKDPFSDCQGEQILIRLDIPTQANHTRQTT